MQIDVTPLTLTTAANGALERQFQVEKDRMLDVFLDDGEQYETKDGRLQAEITCKLHFVFDPATGSLAVAVRATSKLPSLRASSRMVLLKNRQILDVPDDAEQVPLFPKQGPRVVSTTER